MADDRLDTASDAAGLAAMISRAAACIARICRRWIAGIRPFAAISTWKSGPTAPGSIWVRRLDGQPLVRLFSTVLRKDEDGKTYLVTPVEKVGIRVVDAPFLAVEMTQTEVDGEPLLTFRTNVGDIVEAGAEHPLRFVMHGENAELKPYLHVRGRLEALVSRAVMYDLVELGEHIDVDGVAMFCLRSGGEVFPGHARVRA